MFIAPFCVGGTVVHAQHVHCVDPTHPTHGHNCESCLLKTSGDCARCQGLGFECHCSCRPGRGSSRGDRGHRVHPIPALSVSLTVDPLNYLARLLMSIDYPINRILIQVGNADPGVRAEIMGSMKEAQRRNEHFLHNNVRVKMVPQNPGAAHGMNNGLRYLLDNDDFLPDENAFVLVVNADIRFKSGTLRTFAENMRQRIADDADFGMGFMNLHPGATWSAFAPTRRLVQHVGLFDENFYPAYMEDVDFARRLFLSGLRVAMFPGALVAHGPEENGEKFYISGTTFIIQKYANSTNTKKVDVASQLQKLVNRGIQSSLNYYALKWGREPEPKSPCLTVKQLMDGANCSTGWKRPFNSSNMSLRDWRLGRHRRLWIETGQGRLGDAAVDNYVFFDVPGKTETRIGSTHPKTLHRLGMPLDANLRYPQHFEARLMSQLIKSQKKTSVQPEWRSQ